MAHFLSMDRPKDLWFINDDDDDDDSVQHEQQ